MMRKCLRLAVIAAFVTGTPVVASAAELVAGGAPKAAAAFKSSAGKDRVRGRSYPQPYEYYRYYRSYWEYGYYQLYGTFGPIGYLGYYRPYSRDPWSWWKLP
jgi:hypothetical protein